MTLVQKDVHHERWIPWVYQISADQHGCLGCCTFSEAATVQSAHFLGYGNNFWFQDNGAPCHRARIVHEWKVNNGIQSLLWLSQSPDLNSIENLWWDIKKALRTRQNANLNELEMNVKHCWEQIAVDQCEGLVKIMPRRVQAVLTANGGYTK